MVGITFLFRLFNFIGELLYWHNTMTIDTRSRIMLVRQTVSQRVTVTSSNGLGLYNLICEFD